MYAQIKNKEEKTQRCESGANKIQKKKLALNINGCRFPDTLLTQFLITLTSFPCGHKEEIKHKTSQLRYG